MNLIQINVELKFLCNFYFCRREKYFWLRIGESKYVEFKVDSELFVWHFLLSAEKRYSRRWQHRSRDFPRTPRCRVSRSRESPRRLLVQRRDRRRWSKLRTGTCPTAVFHSQTRLFCLTPIATRLWTKAIEIIHSNSSKNSLQRNLNIGTDRNWNIYYTEALETKCFFWCCQTTFLNWDIDHIANLNNWLSSVNDIEFIKLVFYT